MTEQLENGSFFIFDDALENETAPRTLSGNSQDNTSNNVAAPFLHNDSMEDQDDTLSTD